MTAVDTLVRAPVAAAQTVEARRAHLPGLDGLRGVAVLLVVAYHALPERLPGGFVGVDVFFVLSGFLITALLLRERDESGRVHLGRFWVRRIRRLVPALLVMVVVASAATLVVGRDTGAGLRGQVVAATTWVSNWWQIRQGWSYSDGHLPPLFNHLWSLGIEEQFYLLWPLVLLAALVVVGRRGALRLAAGLAVVSVVLMGLWYWSGDPTRAYMGLDSHAFGLLLGACLALGRFPQELTGSPVPPRSVARLTLLGALGLVVIGAFSATVAWRSDVTFLGGLGVANLAAAGVVLAVASRTPVASALGWAPLRWLGERSYGLYLWHWPMIVVAVRLAPAQHRETAACLAVLLALGVATLSYRHLERPMCRDGIGATVRTWMAAVTAPRGRRITRARSIGTVALATALVAGVALWRAPVESEVELALSAGEAVVIDSVADLEPPPAEQPPAVTAGGCSPVAPDAPVSAFGDSVTVAVAPVLTARRPGTAAIATVGWQYGDVSTAVRQVAAAGQLQPTVLIATGTNGVVDAADLDALVTHELAGVQVGLVVPSVPGRPWADQAVQAVHGVAGAHGHVRLVDWNGLALQHPELMTADRVHPNSEGQGVLVDLVDQTLAQC